MTNFFTDVKEYTTLSGYGDTTRPLDLTTPTTPTTLASPIEEPHKPNPPDAEAIFWYVLGFIALFLVLPYGCLVILAYYERWRDRKALEKFYSRRTRPV